MRPSDDPQAASRAVQVSQAQAITSQYTDSRVSARNALSMEESVLNSVGDAVTSAKTLMHYLSTLKARYGCSIVVVHHNRKRPNEGKTKHVISLSDVFGSVFLTAEPDFVVNIDKRAAA